MNISNEFISEKSEEIGKAFRIAVWKSKNDIREKKQQLKNPNSLENYRSGFPIFLLKFFDEFIITLENMKHKILNKKRKQRDSEEKSFNITHT